MPTEWAPRTEGRLLEHSGSPLRVPEPWESVWWVPLPLGPESWGLSPTGSELPAPVPLEPESWGLSPLGSETEPIAGPGQMEFGRWAFSPPESCSESASGHSGSHARWFPDAGRWPPCCHSGSGQTGPDPKAFLTSQAELRQPWVQCWAEWLQR